MYKFDNLNQFLVQVIMAIRLNIKLNWMVEVIYIYIYEFSVLKKNYLC